MLLLPPSSHNPLFLLLLTLAALSKLVVALPPPAAAAHPNIHLPSPPLLPSSNKNDTLLSLSSHCRGHDADWLAEGAAMVFSHCTAALARFWQTQVVPTRPEGDFEFLSHTARPMWKPVTKGIGSCVLTIAMLNFYPPGVLGEEPGSLDPLYDNDVSSFFKAWNAMHDVMFACKGPGWVRIGDISGSIGVFVWHKFSAMDRVTPSGTINGLAFNSSSLSTD
ncbi:hypothetical protein Q9189_003447 [Teloschistes chrysophthalmus]